MHGHLNVKMCNTTSSTMYMFNVFYVFAFSKKHFGFLKSTGHMSLKNHS